MSVGVTAAEAAVVIELDEIEAGPYVRVRRKTPPLGQAEVEALVAEEIAE